MKKKTIGVDKWCKEAEKRYGLKMLLKDPWAVLFLTQSKLKDERKWYVKN